MILQWEGHMSTLQESCDYMNYKNIICPNQKKSCSSFWQLDKTNTFLSSGKYGPGHAFCQGLQLSKWSSWDEFETPATKPKDLRWVQDPSDDSVAFLRNNVLRNVFDQVQNSNGKPVSPFDSQNGIEYLANAARHSGASLTNVPQLVSNSFSSVWYVSLSGHSWIKWSALIRESQNTQFYMTNTLFHLLPFLSGGKAVYLFDPHYHTGGEKTAKASLSKVF